MKNSKAFKKILLFTVSLTLLAGLGSIVRAADSHKDAIRDNSIQAVGSNNTSDDLYTWTRVQNMAALKEYATKLGNGKISQEAFPVLMTFDYDGNTYYIESDYTVNYNVDAGQPVGTRYGDKLVTNEESSFDYDNSSIYAGGHDQAFMGTVDTKYYNINTVDGFSKETNSFVTRGNLNSFYYQFVSYSDTTDVGLRLWTSDTHGEKSDRCMCSFLYNNNHCDLGFLTLSDYTSIYTNNSDLNTKYGRHKSDFNIADYDGGFVIYTGEMHTDWTANLWGFFGLNLGDKYTKGYGILAVKGANKKNNYNEQHIKIKFNLWVGTKGVGTDLLAGTQAAGTEKAQTTYLTVKDMMNGISGSVYTLKKGATLVVPKKSVNYLRSGVTLKIEEGATLIVGSGGLFVCNARIENGGLILIQPGGVMMSLDPDITQDEGAGAITDYSNTNYGDLIVRENGRVRMRGYTSSGNFLVTRSTSGKTSRYGVCNFTSRFDFFGTCVVNGLVCLGYSFNAKYDALTLKASEWADRLSSSSYRTQVKEISSPFRSCLDKSNSKEKIMILY